jgi:uncharacterized protein YggE
MMVKDETECCCAPGMGMGPVMAVILVVGMLGGAYLLSQGEYVKVTSGPSNLTYNMPIQPYEHSIGVSATSSKKVAPDELDIQFRVQTESSNAREAQQENAAVSADLKSKLNALGVTDAEMQTTSYSVDPVYDSSYVCDKTGMNCHYDSKLTGYRATNMLMVKLSDLNKGGSAIDAAATAGENQTFVDYVQFTLKDATRRSMEKTLLQEASSEAKSKAQGIATGLGISLGKVLSASESYNYYYPTPLYRNAMMDSAGAAAPPTQLSAGQVDVSATMSASFEIG